VSGGSGVTWVAVGALAVSLFTLGWNIMVAAKRRPRLEVGLDRKPYEVTVAQGEDDYGDPFEDTVEYISFVVSVSNKGAESLTIYDLGLRSKRVTIGVRDLASAQGEPAWEKTWTGPELPATISARGVLEWTIYEAATANFGDDISWRGFADRYRPSSRPRKRSQSREARARVE